VPQGVEVRVFFWAPVSRTPAADRAAGVFVFETGGPYPPLPAGEKSARGAGWGSLPTRAVSRGPKPMKRKTASTP